MPLAGRRARRSSGKRRASGRPIGRVRRGSGHPPASLDRTASLPLRTTPGPTTTRRALLPHLAARIGGPRERYRAMNPATPSALERTGIFPIRAGGFRVVTAANSFASRTTPASTWLTGPAADARHPQKNCHGPSLRPHLPRDHRRSRRRPAGRGAYASSASAPGTAFTRGAMGMTLAPRSTPSDGAGMSSPTLTTRGWWLTIVRSVSGTMPSSGPSESR